MWILLPAFVLTLLLCRCYRPGTWGARLLNCWTFGTVLLMAWNLLQSPPVWHQVCRRNIFPFHLDHIGCV